MKILYCDRFDPENLMSDSVHNYELVTNLSKLGHVVVSLGANHSKSRLGGKGNRKSSLLEYMKRGLRSARLCRVLLNGIRILRYFGHESSIFFSAFIVIVKQKRQFDIIYRRHNLFNSEYLLAKLFDIPLVKEVNGIIADEGRMQNVRGNLFSRIIDTIERLNMRRADRIIVVTSKLKDVLHDDYGVPEEKTVVISNGANTELFKPMDRTEARNKLGLSQSDNYVCFVGSLVRWQGIGYLIQSAPLVLAECPRTHFLIVGEGAMKQELFDEAEQIGAVDRFTFTGRVTYEWVPYYINASDVCIAAFGAERNERTGSSALKLCEYLACAKPVVTSRISGVEFIESHQAGILVAPGAVRELANAIIKLLQAPDLRKKMGENGRKYVSEERSWEMVAKKVAGVCQQLVKEHRVSDS